MTTRRVDPETVHTAAYTHWQHECPRCLEDGLAWRGTPHEIFERGMGRQIERFCGCRKCGLQWTEIFKLAYIKDIREEVAD